MLYINSGVPQLKNDVCRDETGDKHQRSAAPQQEK